MHSSQAPPAAEGNKMIKKDPIQPTDTITPLKSASYTYFPKAGTDTTTAGQLRRRREV